MRFSRFSNLETLVFLFITLLGLVNNEVTVFYVIYLFWFQEFIRTVVDFVYLLLRKKTFKEKISFVKVSSGNFFILYVYLIFIVVLFGFMLNWGDRELLGKNVLVLLFRNIYFNTNILLFLAEYVYFRSKANNTELQLYTFNRRHLVLHLSIIAGAFIQLAFIPNYNIDNKWGSVLVILPFLLLKIFLDKRLKDESS